MSGLSDAEYLAIHGHARSTRDELYGAADALGLTYEPGFDDAELSRRVGLGVCDGLGTLIGPRGYEVCAGCVACDAVDEAERDAAYDAAGRPDARDAVDEARAAEAPRGGPLTDGGRELRRRLGLGARYAAPREFGGLSDGR
jgi:hypothetical protein